MTSLKVHLKLLEELGCISLFWITLLVRDMSQLSRILNIFRMKPMNISSREDPRPLIVLHSNSFFIIIFSTGLSYLFFSCVARNFCVFQSFLLLGVISAVLSHFLGYVIFFKKKPKNGRTIYNAEERKINLDQAYYMWNFLYCWKWSNIYIEDGIAHFILIPFILCHFDWFHLAYRNSWGER